MFCDNFRDDKLKINDDRKVKITLSDFDEKDTMILLTVRSFEPQGKKPDPANYREAWFRLQNEDTNQSIDYTYVRKVEIPDGWDEAGEDNEEVNSQASGAEQNKPKNELIYLAGRIFKEDVVKKGSQSPREETKWVYERWNKAITTESYP